MAERALADMRVSDIRKLIVENASTIGSDEPIDRLLEKIVKEPLSRHVYVVDENNVLIGSVRLNAILQHLFPLMTMVTQDHNRLTDVFSTLFAENVTDIMNVSPVFVKDETPVLEAVRIMIEEKINELPVVDLLERVVGEVNFLEIISAFLELKKGGSLSHG